LVDRKPRGFFWTSEDADEPNAWCRDCNDAYLSAGKDWTKELMKKVDAQPICFSCFQLARQINGFGVH